MDKELTDMTLEELEAFDAENGESDELDADVATDVDTEADTTDSDVPTTETDEVDTTPETPDYVELFNQSGLDKQYPGGIPEMLSRVPETNRFVREQQEELKTLRTTNKQFQDALLARTQPQEETEDEYVDPEIEKAINSKGFINKETFDQQTQRLTEVENNLTYNRVANIVDGYDDIKDVAKTFRTQKMPERGQNAIWDRFIDLSAQYPGLNDVPLETRLSLLYERAKADVVKPDNSKPPVKPLTAQQKLAAQTSKLKNSKSETVNTDNMSADELLKHAQAHGQYEH